MDSLHVWHLLSLWGGVVMAEVAVAGVPFGLLGLYVGLRYFTP